MSVELLWKGVRCSVTLTPDGWIGPPDLDLTRFQTETEAAERFAGNVADTASVPTEATPDEPVKGSPDGGS